MNKITNNEIKNMVVEIAEHIYEMNIIDLNANCELEPIISAMRCENEIIISEVINAILEILN